MHTQDTTSSALQVQLGELLFEAAKAARTNAYVCKPCNAFKNWDFDEKTWHCPVCGD